MKTDSQCLTCCFGRKVLTKRFFIIIYLILLQLLLIFIMELWDYFFYLRLPMIVYLPLSGILNFFKNNSFNWLLKLVQGILKNIRQNWEYLKIFKKELFYNFVSFWWICNKILRRWNEIKKTWKISKLKKWILTAKWSRNNIVTF